MPDLFTRHCSSAKHDAQRNLQGRTHYVDDDTLRWHKSRVISARATDNGLLYAIVTSDALDHQNRSRGFRYVIFDLFGTVIARTALEETYRTSNKATEAMWRELDAIDAFAVTDAAIVRARKRAQDELDALAERIAERRPKAV